MIKINLLPYREKKKEIHFKRQAVVISSIFAVFFLALAVLHISMLFTLSDLREQFKTDQEKLSSLTKNTADVHQFKKDKELLEKKVEIIRNLERNRMDPVYMLDELTSMVPAGQLWLKSFIESETEIKMDGYARDNFAVAKFMKNLEKSRYIRFVDLVSSKQTELAGHKLKQFSLSCGLKKGQ